MSEESKYPFEKRHAALNINSDTFRQIGHKLVDQIADLLANIDQEPVSPGKNVADIQTQLSHISYPEKGGDPGTLLEEAAELLVNNSTFNGHPRFLGYITASASPIGILSELLAAGINANCGGWQLSPMASEIERQTIQWLCKIVNYPAQSGGIICSGGNMANMQAVLIARTKTFGDNIRSQGLKHHTQGVIYASKETHTWVQKAADLFGFGTEQIRWIETDEDLRLRIDLLEAAIAADKAAGFIPFMVVGSAGTVSTGVVDDLDAIAAICSRQNIWFHVDGAYGAVACMTDDYKALFKGMEKADSIALDPHKWLYSPLEAGCTLVKNASHLIDTFSYRPPYYNFDDETNTEINYYENGMQNSRGFKALKVWLALRQAGISGYQQMINTDCKLAEYLYKIADTHPELEAKSCHLSITTFRFIPVNRKLDDQELNKLNEQILHFLKKEGQLFISNAVIDDVLYLRSCIVNFRTSKLDIRRIPAIVCDVGRRIIN